MTEAPQRPQRSALLTFTQAMLVLQALAALFATITLSGLSRGASIDINNESLLAYGYVLMLGLLLAVGVQKRPWGRWVGSALQAPMLLGGLIEPAVAIVGVMFLILWIAALRLGGRIDRERAERASAPN